MIINIFIKIYCRYLRREFVTKGSIIEHNLPHAFESPRYPSRSHEGLNVRISHDPWYYDEICLKYITLRYLNIVL